MFIPNVPQAILNHYNQMSFKKLLEDLNDHSSKHCRHCKDIKNGVIMFEDFKAVYPRLSNELKENVKAIKDFYGLKNKICCIYGTMENKQFEVIPVENARKILFNLHQKVNLGSDFASIRNAIESESFDWFNH